jgi:hypothetical protein
MAQLTAGMKQRKDWRYLNGLGDALALSTAPGMARMGITLQAHRLRRRFLQQVSVQDGVWPGQAQWNADPSSID